MKTKTGMNPFLRDFFPCLIIMSLCTIFLCKPVFGDSIHEAAAAGDYQKTEALLRDNPNRVFMRDNRGVTPLHAATAAGNIEVVMLLIDYKADVNAKINGGLTPLGLAAGAGLKDIVEYLLIHEADVSAADENGFTPLHYAAVKGYRDIVSFLLIYKADVNARSRDGDTPLNLAILDNHKDTAELLIAHNANVNAPDNKGVTPLKIAIAVGNQDMIALLKSRKAYVKSADIMPSANRMPAESRKNETESQNRPAPISSLSLTPTDVRMADRLAVDKKARAPYLVIEINGRFMPGYDTIYLDQNRAAAEDLYMLLLLKSHWATGRLVAPPKVEEGATQILMQNDGRISGWKLSAIKKFWGQYAGTKFSPGELQKSDHFLKWFVYFLMDKSTARQKAANDSMGGIIKGMEAWNKVMQDWQRYQSNSSQRDERGRTQRDVYLTEWDAQWAVQKSMEALNSR